ncbi:BRO family, N-terminal domain [Streptococcus gallolyticus]|uniref:BRO family, N-terminal domain n=1 Tax=Streptococcus gallolyticus TaxID=315405 RepID=A0A1I7JSG3_9STRE|nr:ORF6C domain-containing protein [Streptococcus gallolyticus]SFC88874.1 BRO family, N-terminal domain [Streptococcus gallolyticus]SFU88131.1 BRO family, N-terminal domain [Streptococcus gallolyticus]
MMNVQVFNNEEFGQVRTLEIDGMVYFSNTDVCGALEINNPSQALKRLRKDGVISNEVIDNLGRKQVMKFISESNLYKLIFQSKKKEAEKFTDWVTSEVLPTIRKHGSYVAPVNPLVSTEDAFIQLFQTQKEIKQEQAVMRDDIVYLKEEQPVNPAINQDLTKVRNKAVVKCLGGYDAPAYSDSKLRQKVFCQAARDFKELFKIPRYDLLKKKDIERAYDYWQQWQPQTNLRLEIEQANKQLSLSF